MTTEKIISDKKDNDEITRLQQQLFAEGVVSRKLLDAVPSPLLIINERWQVVYANGAVLTLLSGSDSPQGSGLSEGEAFHCVHARQGDKDSRRYQSCQVCSIARLLSRSLKGEKVSEDCHLTCDLAETVASFDLRVWATPLEFHGEHFSILTLVDISDKRRRELLENACYHDLLNTLTSIRGVLSVVKDEDVEDQAAIFKLLEKMTQDSIDEITNLRLLEKAQQQAITPNPESIGTHSFLDLVRDSFQQHPAADGKILAIDEGAADHIIESDYQLLRRIIGNMLINAFEATEEGGVVGLGCDRADEGVRFWVHNRKYIPQSIQRQIFSGDVTTKGHSRGTGIYSIMLLSAALGGEVNFTSTESEGTTFSLWLPEKYTG